ncbi:MAG: hypothetical protein JKX99_11540 [Robiginitomaculum sp.]|nr:hypothetical protein [Robiginitomaculum sp.]
MEILSESKYHVDIIQWRDFEIIHYYDEKNNIYIESSGNQFSISVADKVHKFTIPVNPVKKLLLKFRITRRLFRLDKSNAVFNKDGTAIIVLFLGNIYRYELSTRKCVHTGTLRQCRNVLHQGICVTPEGHIIFGEYGSNVQRDSVPIWISKDDGFTWQIAYEFSKGKIKHVHGVYFDHFTQDLWIPTGDFDGECYLVRADTEFNTIKRYGDGTQQWRPVSLFFTENSIIWGMDSQLETNFLKKFNRRSEQLEAGQDLPGPVWYSKQLNDGVALLQTTREIGPGVKTDYVHIFLSQNLADWHEISRYRKDHYPMKFFKYGVLSFADGDQSSKSFAIHGEGLKGFDGRSAIARIVATSE